ncbi:MAG TPA: dTDP-4-dehydrorhamnose 3,5-epimerase [Flavisolibacter sp.]|nr:dTDP-4-dehydrorhamnose 3,5-epimerase [Flavisolibacter sp.]
MRFKETDINGLIVIEPTIIDDSRGYFYEAYNEKRFHAANITPTFVQDNESKSSYGVIRGLHFQLNPFAQCKLIRVLHGIILDVAVDIRKGSPTFGQAYTLQLSAENKKQLFIPAGFAHGFSVLSETAIVLYKCDTFYNKESEGGIRFNDATLNIDWKIPAGKEIISPKDQLLPSFEACKNNFDYKVDAY